MSSVLAQWLDQAGLDQAAPNTPTSVLSDAFRQRAWDALQATGFPQLKNEDWKYTSLRALDQSIAKTSGVDEAYIQAQLQQRFGDNLPAEYLVFAGGVLVPQFSQWSALTLSQDDALNEAAEAYLSALQGAEDAFVRLCLARSTNVWRASLATDTATTVHIVHVAPNAAAHDDAALALQQLLLHVDLNPGQQLSLVEHFLMPDARVYNYCFSALLDNNAQLHHIRLIHNDSEASLLSRAFVRLKANAQYHHADAIDGGRLIRHEGRIHYLGDGASASMASAAQILGKTRVDQDWLMVHSANHCHTHQCFRAAVADRSAATYTGRARIDQNIKASIVDQSSRGLMLSPDAEVNARPVLEIYADEVQASHGATVGCLDEAAQHYLQTRGVPAALARQMLIESFVLSAFEQVQQQDLLEQLQQVYRGSEVAELDAL
jgi:Fe-S cluster assembly protein SufD